VHRGGGGAARHVHRLEKHAEETDGEYLDGGLYGITVFTGKRRSGKTRRLGSACATVRRLVWFDGRGAVGPGETESATRFDVLCEQPGELRSFLRAHLAGPFRVLYRPRLLPPVGLVLTARKPDDSLAQHFAAVTQCVIACGSLIYAIDEVDRICTAGWAPWALSYLINQGRHVRVSLAVTSRRPAQIPRELTSQAHRIYIFKMTEPGDLSYLEEYVGRTGCDAVKSLKLYHALRWEESEGHRVVGPGEL